MIISLNLPVAIGLAIGLGVLGLGILWAPLASMICRRWTREATEEQKAAIGDSALASMAMLLPWVFLLLRLRNKPVAGSAWVVGHAVVLSLWLVGPFGFWVNVGFESLTGPEQEIRAGGLGTRVLWATMAAVFASAHTILMARAYGRVRSEVGPLSSWWKSNPTSWANERSYDVFKAVAVSYLFMLVFIFIHFGVVFLTHDW